MTMLIVTSAHAKMYDQTPKEHVKIKNTEITSEFKNEKNAKDLYNKIKKLETLKDKKGRQLYRFKYESNNDLYNTCIIICKNETENFNRFHIASIIIQESKFCHKAVNRTDGGKGLAQVMKRYWGKEFPWYKNEFDKNQSIKACTLVLEKNFSRHNNVWKAIKHYNGSNEKATQYSKKIQNTYSKLLIA